MHLAVRAGSKVQQTVDEAVAGALRIVMVHVVLLGIVISLVPPICEN